MSYIANDKNNELALKPNLNLCKLCSCALNEVKPTDHKRNILQAQAQSMNAFGRTCLHEIYYMYQYC